MITVYRYFFDFVSEVMENMVCIFSAIPLLGYLPQDMNGMSIFDFYHRDDTETLYNIYKRSKTHSLFIKVLKVLRKYWEVTIYWIENSVRFFHWIWRGTKGISPALPSLRPFDLLCWLFNQSQISLFLSLNNW